MTAGSGLSTVGLGDEYRSILCDRIRSRVSIEDRGYRTPCWISDRAGGGSDMEYTKIGITGSTGRYEIWYTHRLAYELHVGPIPEGRLIDHRCDQTKCCNPEHLAPVTPRENLLRGRGLSSAERAQRDCIHGHPFDDENTYIDRRGRRHCRQCRRARNRARPSLATPEEA